MNGEIIHVEFPSADFEKSSSFYQTLFGWHPESEQAGGHLGLRVPGSAQSSWVRSALAYAPAPVVFVSVADVVATLAEVKRLGGRVLVAKMNLPGRGHFALLADPDGNVVAVTSAAASASSAGTATATATATATTASAPSSKNPKTPPAAKSAPDASPKAKTKLRPKPSR